MVDPQNKPSLERQWQMRFIWHLIYPEITFIGLKVSPEMKKSTYWFSCAPEHLPKLGTATND